MVKYLVLLLLIAALIWWARAGRRSGGAGSGPSAAKPPRGSDAPVMVECAHCGIHLPRTESLPGPGGAFCCEAHRAAGAKVPSDGSDL